MILFSWSKHDLQMFLFILSSYPNFASYIPYLFLHFIYFLNEESVLKQFPLCQRQTNFAFHNKTQNYEYKHFSLNKNIKRLSRKMHKLKYFDETQTWKIKQSLSYFELKIFYRNIVNTSFWIQRGVNIIDICKKTFDPKITPQYWWQSAYKSLL